MLRIKEKLTSNSFTMSFKGCNFLLDERNSCVFTLITLEFIFIEFFSMLLTFCVDMFVFCSLTLYLLLVYVFVVFTQIENIRPIERLTVRNRLERNGRPCAPMRQSVKIAHCFDFSCHIISDVLIKMK